MRYVAFEKGDSTEGDNMFDEVSGFVQGQRSEEDERDEFQGTWMLVAQWDHVHPDPHGADDHMGIPEALLERVSSGAVFTVKSNCTDTFDACNRWALASDLF